MMNRILVGVIPSVWLGLSALTPLNATAADETYEQAVNRIVDQGAETGAETPALARDVKPAGDGSVSPPTTRTRVMDIEPEPAMVARPYDRMGE